MFSKYYHKILMKKYSRVYLLIIKFIAIIQGSTTKWVFYAWVDLKQKHWVLHIGMITWNSLPDIFKVNVSFSMFKSKIQNFLPGKILENIDVLRHYDCIFFLTCLQLRVFKCNCFWFLLFCCEISNYFFCGYNQDNQECIVNWYVLGTWNYYSKTIST